MEFLKGSGGSDDVLALYRASGPARMVEIEEVRIWPGANLVEENTDHVPGFYAFPCGYVVFATTICDDAYCFDTRSGLPTVAVVLIAHDLEPPDDATTREELAKVAKPIAPWFERFLELLQRR